MDAAKFQSLPPLKRLRLLQQQNDHQSELNIEPKPLQSNLPAKKRLLSRHSFIQSHESNDKENTPPNPPTPYCLPAKKRISAIVLESSPIKSSESSENESAPPNPPTPTQCCLPSKKRISAIIPVLTPVKTHEIELETPSANPDPYCLPAKERISAVEPESSPIKSSEKENAPPNPNSTLYCLPAKKRIWAFQPELTPTKSPPRFDLNVEYTPSPESKEKTTQLEIEPENEELEDDDGIKCAVCESTDADPSDPIVFCDGCDLMVHSTCYGNPLVQSIPEGDWFCSRCSNSAETCCLCPVLGGAMKSTNDGRWAHIVCAVLVPEVFFEDPEGRDGIDCTKVPKKRWMGSCYLCKERNKGCVIECSESKCNLAFHVTCGLKDDLCIELKHGKKNSGGIVAGFCKEHTHLWKKQKQSGKFKIVARDGENKP